MALRKFFIKRLFQSIIVFLACSAIIFTLVRLSGVNPITSILGGGKETPEAIAAVRIKYHFDQPLLVQYFFWIGNIFKGNFGESYKFLQPVTTLIMERLKVTTGLILISLMITPLTAIAGGMLSAVKKNTWLDRFISISSLVMLSIPSFLTGILMIFIISTFTPGISFVGSFQNLGEFFLRLIFPAIALSLSNIAIVLRITRNKMIEQLNSNYVLNATAKGLSFRRIIFGHAFKNALSPILTIVGIQIGAMLSGTVLVENVFALPGVGSLLVDSIKASDYPVVQGLALLFIFVFVSINLIIDISYGIIDPRIRVNKS
ncbi:MAG: ABC transporter permease [Eubacteriales bacterium]|jgi:peptide/nickel transport system permease protein